MRGNSPRTPLYFAFDARRFEVATQPFQDVAGFTASLELLLEVGPERIREHVLAVLDPLWRDVSRGVHRRDGQLLVMLDVDRVLAIGDAR